MRTKWQIKDLETYRAEIYQELKVIQDEASPEVKFYHILERIKQLDSLEPEDQLRRFIYTMCALVHHIQFGGLQDAEVKQLLDLASDLLKYNGIQPSKSKLSTLHGELRMVRSQIFLNQGEFWPSIWNQLIAEKLSGPEMPGGEPYQASLLGIKCFRLGFSEMAQQYFMQVEQHLNSGRLFEQARISRIKLLRLAGERDIFHDLITASRLNPELSEAFQLEVNWEEACFQAMEECDLGPLYQLVYESKSHYQESYILELQFWAWCFPNYRWLHRLPKLRTIARRQELDFKQMGYFYRAAQILDQIYDEKLQDIAKLEKIEQVFRYMERVRTIDKELFLWLALAKWLEREKHPVYYRLTMERYHHLSLSLSLGKSNDVLGLLVEQSKRLIS
ncbi:MAG: hypothetical protein ACOH5I_02065 [Oligoflexus sp.]